MDTGTTTFVSKFIPTAESPNWPLFAGLLIVMLALGPKALDSWRRFRYASAPGIERRKETPCEVHSARIKELESQIEEQQAELVELRHEFQEGLRHLRDFIEEKFQQDRAAAQSDRIALEGRLTTQMNAIMGLVARGGIA